MALLVNGERIENAALEEERRALRRALIEKMPEDESALIEQRAREWAAENLIERVLLQQAALRDPEPLPAEVAADAELGFRIDRLVGRLTAHAARPRRKDIVEYYRKNQASFVSDEVIHAAHIVKNIDEQNTEESARAAIEHSQRELKEGKSFDKVADEFSDCPGRGGDLGQFGRGQMVDEFDAVAFSLAPGQMSEIFRTPFGFHIVKLHSRRPAGPVPLEDVSAEIEELLFAQKKQKLVEQHLDSLLAKAEVRQVD